MSSIDDITTKPSNADAAATTVTPQVSSLKPPPPGTGAGASDSIGRVNLDKSRLGGLGTVAAGSHTAKAHIWPPTHRMSGESGRDESTGEYANKRRMLQVGPKLKTYTYDTLQKAVSTSMKLGSRPPGGWKQIFNRRRRTGLKDIHIHKYDEAILDGDKGRFNVDQIDKACSIFLQRDGNDVNTPCWYNPKVSQWEVDLDAIWALLSVMNQAYPDRRITMDQTISKNVKVRKSCSAFALTVVCELILRHAWGPYTSFADKNKSLSSYDHEGVYGLHIYPLAVWCHNILDFPHDVKLVDILEKNCYEAKKWVKQRVSQTAIWSDAYVLEKMDNKAMEPKYCRGIYFPLALCFDSLYDGFYNEGKKGKTFITADEVKIAAWQEQANVRLYTTRE